MPNYRIDKGWYVPDEDTGVLGDPPAKNKEERRATREHLLHGIWDNMDIGCLERVDDPEKRLHGWIAYPWKKDPAPRRDNPEVT